MAIVFIFKMCMRNAPTSDTFTASLSSWHLNHKLANILHFCVEYVDIEFNPPKIANCQCTLHN